MNTSDKVYHLAIKGVQSGPFPEEDLTARLSRGELDGTELCWTEAWKDWKPLALAFPGVRCPAPLVAPPPIPAPLAAPLAEIDGNNLVVLKNSPFPPICVRTGASQDLIARPLRSTLSWHPPAVYFALLANIIIYVIFAAIFRKASAHTIYLSRTARAAQIKWHLANWLIFLGAWGLLGAAISQESGAIGLTAAAAFIASIVIYFKKVRLLHAAKIDQIHVHIGGIPRDVMMHIVAAWK